MVRPCVARGFHESGGCGLASMYPVSDWSSLWAPDHHGYQRACDLITGQASTGPFGSPVFARAGKTDPPSRLVLSQTSAGNGCWGYIIAHSSFRAVPLFVPRAVPSSRPTHRRWRRAQGAVKAGRRAGLTSGSHVARPRLERPEHGAIHFGRGAIACFVTHSKLCSLLRTAQAMRASLLASAMASTLWCSRFLAASIQDLSP